MANKESFRNKKIKLAYRCLIKNSIPCSKGINPTIVSGGMSTQFFVCILVTHGRDETHNYSDVIEGISHACTVISNSDLHNMTTRDMTC